MAMPLVRFEKGDALYEIALFTKATTTTTISPAATHHKITGIEPKKTKLDAV
jgi:hypothetical protein